MELMMTKRTRRKIDTAPEGEDRLGSGAGASDRGRSGAAL
jgi:hypothetical protein